MRTFSLLWWLRRYCCFRFKYQDMFLFVLERLILFAPACYISTVYETLPDLMPLHGNLLVHLWNLCYTVAILRMLPRNHFQNNVTSLKDATSLT